jgi:hypothetical protein
VQHNLFGLHVATLNSFEISPTFVFLNFMYFCIFIPLWNFLAKTKFCRAANCFLKIIEKGENAISKVLPGWYYH